MTPGVIVYAGVNEMFVHVLLVIPCVPSWYQVIVNSVGSTANHQSVSLGCPAVHASAVH